MMLYGMARSLTRNAAAPPLTGGTEPPHQASSISSVAAPMSSAMEMAEPTLPFDPDEAVPSTPW